MKNIILISLLIGLVLLVGCNNESCEDVCSLRGNMQGSEVNIRSSAQDGECVFPFNYTVNDDDDLSIVIEEECVG